MKSIYVSDMPGWKRISILILIEVTLYLIGITQKLLGTRNISKDVSVS